MNSVHVGDWAAELGIIVSNATNIIDLVVYRNIQYKDVNMKTIGCFLTKKCLNLNLSDSLPLEFFTEGRNLHACKYR